MKHEAVRPDKENTPDIVRSGELIVSKENYEKEDRDDSVKKLTKVALDETVVLSAPEGWKTTNQIAKDYQIDFNLARKLACRVIEDIEDIEDSVRLYKNKTNQPASHFSPEAIAAIEKILEEDYSPVPEGWVTKKDLANTYNASYDLITKTIGIAAKKFPDEVRKYRIAGTSTGASRVHYGKNIQTAIHDILSKNTVAPKGWLTINGLAKYLEIEYEKSRKIFEAYSKSNPTSFATYRSSSGPTLYISPDLTKEVKTKLENDAIGLPPDGWMCLSEIESFTGKSPEYIKRRIKVYAKSHSDIFREFMGRNKGVPLLHYHPDLVQDIYNDAIELTSAPKDWETRAALSTELDVSYRMLDRIIEPFRETNKEWFQYYEDKGGRSAEYIHPELVEHIKREVSSCIAAPEGWSTGFALSKKLGNGQDTIQRIAEEVASDSPEWIKVYRTKAGQPRVHYHPDLVRRIKQESENRASEVASNEWISLRFVAIELGVAQATARLLVESCREEYSEMFALMRTSSGRGRGRGALREHYHRDLIPRLQERVGGRAGYRQRLTEEEFLSKRLVGDLECLSDRESPDGSDFKALIGLFDAESALDILYHRHPEYRKLPVPYVKSMIGEYLGDFMMVKGEFSLEGLEKGAAFLSTPAFKDRLTEVVKMDCLHMLNYLGRMSLDDVNAVAVTEYLEGIRQKSAHIDSPELEEILSEVEAYYTLLFNDIHKPGHFIDQLGDNRLFPDINQRINVQELLFKHKILIADEMGTGKSASAIMAKEIVGAKQALVVVPSNVVSVWENYLSDKMDGDKQLGYFKEGRAPNVLVVNSLDDLKNSNKAEYDYIVISQERLNDEYTDILETFDYDMMIVDEMHKLKNITSGKRSNNLIRLAERVDGNDKYLALLSGTPVPNKVGDVALTLKLLYPQDFAGIDNKQLTSQILNGDVLDLRSRLMMRTQMKSLTENIDMPEMKQETEKIYLSDYERDIYDILLEEDELTASEKLALLRQFTLNPRMLDATPDVVGAKVVHTGDTLRESFSYKDKIVMFVNGYIEGIIRGEDTIIPDLQLPENVEVQLIHGGVSKQERLDIQQQLQTRDKKMLLLVSGQTADTGVDFSGADEVFHYNEPWSLYDKQQQTARVYRPGLESDLTVRTFVTEATLEEGINRYIEKKYLAIEKILRGIPISDIEKNMLAQAEKTVDPNAEVSPELAKYYFSSQDKMARIYGYVKEIGEDKFLEFLSKYGQDYANAYADLTGARSYQANMARLSGSVIKDMIDSQGKAPHDVRILDLASGPEILQRHVVDELSGSVYSLDINPRHFTQPGKKMTGSISKIPVADGAVDYVNLSLGLHYTRWAPSRGNFERLETLMEINRVLSVGGRATIGMIHSLKLNDGSELRDTLGKLGFKVIDGYTGNVSNGKSFDTQLLTLEKITHITDDVTRLASAVDAKTLKFTKNEAGLSETRKIATQFNINGTMVPVHLNTLDQKVLKEEEESVLQMETLQKNYGGIERIPEDKIVSQGFSRVFNGKRYVLFRRLNTDPSAVLIR